MKSKGLSTADYDYTLPEERIAMHPLTERDAAKMLVYRQGEILHRHFRNLTEFLPDNTLLVLNDTRVVHARLLFQRSTGARIEVFCLHPIAPYKEMNLAMQSTGRTTWECMAGNQRRWKPGETIEMPFGTDGMLKATLAEKLGREVIVEFSWTPEHLTWSKVLEEAGKMPLPPYIHREAEKEDEEDYQTVFARQDGAVAAPTAGLHITEALLEQMHAKGITTTQLTLHVGAGTFQPVEHDNILEHPMHNEEVIYTRELVSQLQSGNYFPIALGTTSMRALETLYWFGNSLQQNPGMEVFFREKLLSEEELENAAALPQAMQNILNWMDKRGVDTLTGSTEIFIYPSYIFRICKGLITNFHMPQSTLLMLVSAFIGEDWKKIYETALDQDYRFLSYGDGMLLLP